MYVGVGAGGVVVWSGLGGGSKRVCVVLKSEGGMSVRRGRASG